MAKRISPFDDIFEQFPKKVELRSSFRCQIRPLRRTDEQVFREFLQSVPESERMFLKHRIQDPTVIHGWCEQLDYGRNLPLLAWLNRRVIGAATLHQQLGGWKRHIGRVSVLVHPSYRGRGLAQTMVMELVEIARRLGLSKLEAEFVAEQKRALEVFGMIGFSRLAHLPDYVRDMQAIPHDYILMGLNLVTDEEYAGVG